MINGELVSENNDLVHTFYDSGRHKVELISKSGDKVASKTQDVFVYPPEQCMVLMETTLGDMVMSLSELTPKHLNNFTKRVNSGYYDGIHFHRVIDDFMIQGGNNETRRAGKTFSEPATVAQEINHDLMHFRGALAAARMPDDMNPDKASSGSQFYLVDGRSYTAEKFRKFQANGLIDYTESQVQKYLEVGGAPQLDGEYTVFGQLISGFDVLDKITQSDTDKMDKPLENITILKAKMLN